MDTSWQANNVLPEYRVTDVSGRTPHQHLQECLSED